MAVKNDSGILLKLEIVENGEPIDISGMTVDVTFKNGDYRIVKPATLTDSAHGLCEVEIDASDTADSGILDYQVALSSYDGDRFSADTNHITINEML